MVPDQWPLPVDLRWVESFAVVAEELHFTRAARRLSVSQPAVSQHVARLERQMGVSLFSRTPSGVVLTPAGLALWREVQPAFAALRSGVAAARTIGGGAAGELRVVHLSSYGSYVVPEVAARLRDEHPDLTVVLREASVEEQLEALRRRSADVGVLHLDPDVALSEPGLITTVIGEAPRFVALPLDHPLSSSTTLSFGELAGESWIMPVGASEQSVQEENVIVACRRHGFAPRVSQHANSVEAMIGLVRSGFGVAPAPWSVALRRPPGVDLVRITPDRHNIVSARRAESPIAATIDVFIDVMADVIAVLLAGLLPGGSTGEDRDDSGAL